jgi:hypothetical protein
MDITFIGQSPFLLRILIFCLLLWFSWWACFTWPVRVQEKDAQQKKFERIIISEISKNKTEEDLKEFIALKYKEVYNSSEKDAIGWADNLVNNLKNKKELQEELSKKAIKVSGVFRMKWEPFYNYILQQFDTRIEALIKKGIKIQYEKNDVDIIKVNPALGNGGVVRKAKFDNNWEIWVEVRAASIENSKLSQYPIIFIHKAFKGSYQRAVTIGFGENNFSVGPDDMRYKEYGGTSVKDPLEDSDFRDKVDGVINEVIASMVIY